VNRTEELEPERIVNQARTGQIKKRKNKEGLGHYISFITYISYFLVPQT